MDNTYRILLLAIMHLIWSLFYLPDADAQLTVFTPESLSVRKGDTLTLVCTYEPKTEELLYFGALSWQIGDTVLASYVCPGNCSRTNENSDRYTLEVDSMFSGNLTITGITLEDDNTYECKVTTYQGNSGSYMRLVVNVPPSDVNIMFNSTIISDGETLTLQEGTSSTIICESLGTRPASAITWYLDGVQLSSGVGRSEFTPNTDDSRLSDASSNIIIKPTRQNHEQSLRCQATSLGISRDTIIRLSVDGPPDPPVITSIPDNLVENQQTSISCQADNGHPSPSFQWFIGNRNLSADAALLVYADVNNRIDATSQLRYLPLRGDNGLALECHVFHDGFPQPLKVMSDQLTVNYCPTAVEVTVCPEVAAGTFEAIMCRSGASNPASYLIWTKDSRLINNPSALQTRFEESSDPFGRRTTLSYIKNFTKEDYEQRYKCCSTVSPLCDSSVCSQPCIPNVKYAPETPTISINMPASQVAEGTADLVFSCRAEGNPRPALTWVMASNKGLMLDQLTQEDGSQLLRFRDVSRHYAGVYRCIANNNIPPRSSNEDQLVVRFPPTIHNKGNNFATANEGKNVSLTCVVKGNPSPRVRWERLDNHSAELWDRTFVVSTEVNSDYESVVTSTLNIIDVHPDIDHGNYRCTAESTAGTDEAVIYLSVTYPPTTPRITSNKPSGAVSEGTEDLQILCEPADGWPRPALVWVYPDDPSLSLDQVTLENGSQLLIFSEVSRASAGIYRCKADNNVPPSRSADHQLIVGLPGTIRNKDDNKVVVLEGSNVILICEAEGSPSPFITWQRVGNRSNELGNGILVTQSEQKTDYISIVTSTLIITEVKPEMESTNFSCIANNTYGADHKVFHLRKKYPDSRLMPIFISAPFIVIFIILIFVFIRCCWTRKLKRAREQSPSPEGKNADTASLPSLSFFKPVDKATDLSITGMQNQQHDYMSLHTYETPIELADYPPCRSPRWSPNCTVEEGISARMDLEHTYATAVERTPHEDSGERIYINNSVLIPRVV